MNSSALRSVGSPDQPPTPPPIDSIFKRLEILENTLLNARTTLKDANDRLLGGQAEGGSATQSVPKGGALLSAIDNSLERIESLAHYLSGEASRTDNLSSR